MENPDLGYERLSDTVILVDGKYYRLMSDKEAAAFIWGKPSALSKKTRNLLARQADQPVHIVDTDQSGTAPQD